MGEPDDMTGEDDKGWEEPDGVFDVLSFSTTIFLSGTKLFVKPPAIIHEAIYSECTISVKPWVHRG